MRSKIKKNHEFFELSKFRRRFMLLVLLTLFCILFSRAFFLQGMQRDFLQQEGFEGSNRNIELYAYRGKIYDRNNQILAASETVRSITMEPNRVGASIIAAARSRGAMRAFFASTMAKLVARSP